MLTDEKGNIPAEMQKPVLGYDGKGLVYSDDFSKDKLELQWQWNHNPVDNAWSLTERKGWLRLKTSRIVPNIFLAPNTISTRTEGPACEGIIKMDVSKMKDGDVAGLSAFQGDAALLSARSASSRNTLPNSSYADSTGFPSHAPAKVLTCVAPNFPAVQITFSSVFLCSAYWIGLQ